MRSVEKALLPLVMALVLLAAVQPGYGQTVTTGSMPGVVADAQQGVLPGATVVAVHTPTGTSYETVTGADGHYSFLNVRVGGPYTVTVTMAGFRQQQDDGRDGEPRRRAEGRLHAAARQRAGDGERRRRGARSSTRRAPGTAANVSSTRRSRACRR